VDKWVSPRRFVVVLLGGFALFALILASLDEVYRQFATQSGVRNRWTIYCEMDERVGGQASFRFPSSDFYAVARITRLDPGRAVAWEVLESKHPADSGFIDLNDWVRTRIDFEMEPLAPDRTALRLTHSGLALKECFGVCSVVGHSS